MDRTMKSCGPRLARHRSKHFSRIVFWSYERTFQISGNVTLPIVWPWYYRWGS